MCYKCFYLTEWYLKEHPDKKGFAKCEHCYKQMQDEGCVLIKLPYDPSTGEIESDGSIIYL